LAGAALASHAVVHTVGYGLLIGVGLAVPGQVVVIAVAFALTTLFNRLRVPTSTIQILVFSVAGTAIGAGTAVRWSTIAQLAVVWAAAPVIASLGYLLTHGLDLVPVMRRAAAAPAGSRAGVPAPWRARKAPAVTETPAARRCGRR